MTSHLNLDPDGRGLAFEDGYRTGLAEGRQLQLAATSEQVAGLVSQMEALAKSIARQDVFAEQLRDRIAGLERSCADTEARTAERIAAWLEVDLSEDCSEAIAGVRAGAWRTP